MTVARYILLAATLTASLVPLAVASSAAHILPQQPPAEPDKPSDGAEKPEQDSTEQPDSEEPEALPSLDDLLGTTSESTKTDAPSNDDLARKLQGAEVSNAFRQAVGLMGQASARLSSKDAGLATQRLQEDAVRKLDELIAAQQKQQGKPSSKKPKPDESQPSPGSKPSTSKAPQPSQGDNQSEVDPPARRDGQLNPEVAAARAAWGALPARVRETLMQGSQDRFSALYERTTQEYYRRLAEQSQRP